MAKQGRAADALRESVVASFVGGILGVIVLQLFAPPLARVSLMFGPPEYFILAIFGMTIIASLSEKMIIKGYIAGFLGMFIGTIGMDPLMGTPRFTFDIAGLVDGVMLVPGLDRPFFDSRGVGDHSAPRLVGGDDPQFEETSRSDSLPGSTPNG